MSQISELIEMLTNIMTDIKKIERKLNQMEIVIEKIDAIEKSIESNTNFMSKIDIKKSKIKVKKYALEDNERLFMPSIRNQYGLPDYQKQFEEMKKAMKEIKLVDLTNEKDKNIKLPELEQE